MLFGSRLIRLLTYAAIGTLWLADCGQVPTPPAKVSTAIIVEGTQAPPPRSEPPQAPQRLRSQICHRRRLRRPPLPRWRPNPRRRLHPPQRSRTTKIGLGRPACWHRTTTPSTAGNTRRHGHCGRRLTATANKQTQYENEHQIAFRHPLSVLYVAPSPRRPLPPHLSHLAPLLPDAHRPTALAAYRAAWEGADPDLHLRDKAQTASPSCTGSDTTHGRYGIGTQRSPSLHFTVTKPGARRSTIPGCSLSVSVAHFHLRS